MAAIPNVDEMKQQQLQMQAESRLPAGIDMHYVNWYLKDYAEVEDFEQLTNEEKVFLYNILKTSELYSLDIKLKTISDQVDELKSKCCEWANSIRNMDTTAQSLIETHDDFIQDQKSIRDEAISKFVADMTTYDITALEQINTVDEQIKAFRKEANDLEAHMGSLNSKVCRRIPEYTKLVESLINKQADMNLQLLDQKNKMIKMREDNLDILASFQNLLQLQVSGNEQTKITPSSPSGIKRKHEAEEKSGFTCCYCGKVFTTATNNMKHQSTCKIASQQ